MSVKLCIFSKDIFHEVCPWGALILNTLTFTHFVSMKTDGYLNPKTLKWYNLMKYIKLCNYLISSTQNSSQNLLKTQDYGRTESHGNHPLKQQIRRMHIY